MSYTCVFILVTFSVYADSVPVRSLTSNSGECDKNCQGWKEAINRVSIQEEKPLPIDDLVDFDVETSSNKKLRSLSDQKTVLMATWSKYELYDGVQQFPLWTTLKQEFYPRVGAMAGQILVTNPTISNNDFRVELSNQVNRLLGMNVDDGVETQDIRKLWVAEVPVLQADADKVHQKQATQGFFRPCLDSPSIHTDSCQYTNATYDWVKDWIATAWDKTGESPKAYPFTGEGYTYNWNEGQNIIGLDEFVLPANASDITFVQQGTHIVEAICQYCETQTSGCEDFNTAEHKRSEKLCSTSSDTLLVV